MVHRGEDARHPHCRILGFELVELGVDRLRHGHIGGALGLEHPERGGRTPVEPGDAAHLGNAVVHLGDFPQAHEFAAGKNDLGIAERLRRLCTAEHANRLLAAPDLGTAAGGIHVERPELFIDFEGREAESLKPGGIQIDANFPIDAAAARHLGDAGNGQQPLGHRVVDEPAELLRRQVGGGDGVVGECAAVDGLPRHLRFEDSLRQIIADLGHGIANVGHGAIDRRADLEQHEYADLTLDDVGRDVAHIADVRYRTFHFLRDLGFHLRGRGARLLDVDVHCRKGHIGLQIDRQTNEGHDTQEEQHHEQHDRRDGMTDGPSGNISHV